MVDWSDIKPGQRRQQFVEQEFARLQIGEAGEHPAVIERRERERRERLAAHDLLFGVWPGVTMGAPPPPAKIEEPAYSVGDPDGDAG